MAYSDVYRSPSQSSGYSVSAIDGIEIKISEKLIPPPQIKRPIEYDTVNPSEILFMEYDFGLEERVLEWSKSQRENVEAIQQAESERVGNRIQEFSQTPDTQAPPAQQTSGESQPNQPAPATNHASDPTLSNPSSAWSGPGEEQSQNRPSLNPFLNIGSSILTPMPINHGGHTRKESGGNKAQTGMIDLKDFENEQDPFENMELKVLNDREELNKMILGAQALPESDTRPLENGSSLHTQDPVSRSPTSSPVNLKDVDYPELESFDSAQFAIQDQRDVQYPRDQAPGQVNLQPDSHRAFYQSSQTTSSMPFSSQNMPSATYSYNQGVPLPPISNPHYYPQQPVSTGGQSFLAPNTSTTSSVGAVATNQTNVTFTTAGAMYTKQLGDKTFIPFQSFYNRNPLVDGTNGHVASNGPGYTQPSTSHGRETPPMNPLRSARSTPDISGSEDRRLPPLMPSSHTPPPTTRPISPIEASGRHSPNLRRKTWEHYNVLPPSPRSAGASSSDSHSPNARSKPGLPNPYDSLPPEAKRLVENIADMGFPKARVARAVKKQGTDDKQVVDFLCQINRLAEKGHDADDVEVALSLCESKLEKAEQYLKLLSQFKELGFSEKNIQDALVSTNLDENRTLDLLTAS